MSLSARCWVWGPVPIPDPRVANATSLQHHKYQLLLHNAWWILNSPVRLIIVIKDNTPRTVGGEGLGPRAFTGICHPRCSTLGHQKLMAARALPCLLLSSAKGDAKAASVSPQISLGSVWTPDSVPMAPRTEQGRRHSRMLPAFPASRASEGGLSWYYYFVVKRLHTLFFSDAEA